MMNLLNINEGFLVDIQDTKDWYAWIDLQPPPPNSFHIVGEVLIPNPGVKVLLIPRVPQGFNPTILLLNIILVQQTGFWPQIMTWSSARYDRVVVGSPYKSVQISYGDEIVAEVLVNEVE